MEKILTQNWSLKDSHTLAVYESTGGYQSLSKLFTMKPEEVTEEVKKSGLRGRGGAGFPTGMKWSFIPKDDSKPKYLCINADESEPGTFKDRYILELNPHQLIEGAIGCAYAIGAKTVYCYIRGEFMFPYDRLQQAVDEAYAGGYLGKNIKGSGVDVDFYLHKGAGAYICGEETALLESLEGKRGYPRIKPPFPAVMGLFGCPTVINNVETIAAVPYIVNKGSAAYRQYGTEKSPGTKLFCVSGHVKKPGNYEVPLGYPLKKLIEEDCGGMRNGKALKAVIPGGSSVPVLTAAEAMEVNLDYEALAAKGTMLGSGGVIVMDESVCMVKSLLNLAHFYAHESCGQCSPCREGTGWSYKILKRFHDGEGSVKDLDLLLEIADNMAGKTVCVLSDALAMPIVSHINKFRAEFEEHVKLGKCPLE
ncbi:MAG: NADH-quinone oxidoreductase subunit NuoF [Deltaproteobacteria bacterium]|nr:NADH-quinone oxidoreductase subunit NuoF [Deltaproteobacteria bacterium]